MILFFFVVLVLFFLKAREKNYPIIEILHLKYFETVLLDRTPSRSEFIAFAKWKFNKGHW